MLRAQQEYIQITVPDAADEEGETRPFEVYARVYYNDGISSGDISAQAYKVVDKDQDGNSTTYSYDLQSGELNSVITPDGTTTSYTYNDDNGLLTKVISGEVSVSYVYNDESETKLKSITHNGFDYAFEYDVMGNIISVEEGDRKEGTLTMLDADTRKTVLTYEYDDQNQLIRENNLYLGKTIVYTYDNGGNLTSKEVYDYTEAEDLSNLIPETIVYGYNSSWKDRLDSYNGQSIEYDSIGNPTSYLGKTLSWTGRTLDSLTEEGMTVTYCYDGYGTRTGKTVGTEVSEYYYADGLLAYEKRGDDKEFYYSYDSDGNLAGIRYILNGVSTAYYPAINSRGDVEAIYDANGVLQAKYIYDSWGNVLRIEDALGNEITDETTIGHLNPIRYRGYYYDAETGFYYVSSRYYDPEVGRFISADITDILGVSSDLYDKNLYAYCDNNPVARIDSTGTVWDTVFDVVSLGTSVMEVVANPANAWNWVNLAADTADLIPFVTGLGETTRLLKTVKKVDFSPVMTVGSPNKIGKRERHLQE